MSFVAEAFAALLIALCLLAWAWIAARVRRGQPLVEPAPRRPVPWGALDLLAIAVFFAGTLAFVAIALSMVRDGADDDVARFEVALGAGTAANVVTLGFAVVWMVFRTGARMSDLGWRGDTIRTDVRTGLVAFAAISVPVYALQYVLSHLATERHPIIEMLGEQPSSWLFVLSGLSAVVVAPVAEEFFFRGLLQGWLESQSMRLQRDVPSAASPDDVQSLQGELIGHPRDDSPYRPPLATEESEGADERAVGFPARTRGPIFVTSALFALMHWGHGFAPVPLFILSLALGWLYQRTHRLLPSIVVHFCLNACSMLMLPFALNAE